MSDGFAGSRRLTIRLVHQNERFSGIPYPIGKVGGRAPRRNNHHMPDEGCRSHNLYGRKSLSWLGIRVRPINSKTIWRQQSNLGQPMKRLCRLVILDLHHSGMRLGGPNWTSGPSSRYHHRKRQQQKISSAIDDETGEIAKVSFVPPVDQDLIYQPDPAAGVKRFNHRRRGQPSPAAQFILPSEDAVRIAVSNHPSLRVNQA